MSSPRTSTVEPCTDNTSTTDMPIGFGRTGEHVLKTPRGWSRVGGVWVRCASVNSGLRSK